MYEYITKVFYQVTTKLINEALGLSDFESKYQDFIEGIVDGGKNPWQQREMLAIPQVPIRLTNIWNGRLDGIMDSLPF